MKLDIDGSLWASRGDYAARIDKEADTLWVPRSFLFFLLSADFQTAERFAGYVMFKPYVMADILGWTIEEACDAADKLCKALIEADVDPDVTFFCNKALGQEKMDE